jgi:hypothetical protein
LHSIQIGTLALNGQMVLYLIYGIVGWLVLKFRCAHREDRDVIMSYASNAFFLWLIVWKGSFILFHLVEFINEPMALLYFDGGARGKWLASLIAVLYIGYRTWRQQLGIQIWMGIGVWFSLGCWFAYHTLCIVIGEGSLWLHVISAVLAAIVLLFLFQKRTNLKKELDAVVWFFIANVLLQFFVTDRSLWLFSFSKQQILFVLAAVLLTGWSSYDEKRQKGSSYE